MRLGYLAIDIAQFIVHQAGHLIVGEMGDFASSRFIKCSGRGCSLFVHLLPVDQTAVAEVTKRKVSIGRQQIGRRHPATPVADYVAL
jgi:hypothetical protein